MSRHVVTLFARKRKRGVLSFNCTPIPIVMLTADPSSSSSSLSEFSLYLRYAAVTHSRRAISAHARAAKTRKGRGAKGRGGGRNWHSADTSRIIEFRS